MIGVNKVYRIFKNNGKTVSYVTYRNRYYFKSDDGIEFQSCTELENELLNEFFKGE